MSGRVGKFQRGAARCPGCGLALDRIELTHGACISTVNIDHKGGVKRLSPPARLERGALRGAMVWVRERGLEPSEVALQTSARRVSVATQVVAAYVVKRIAQDVRPFGRC